MSHFRRTAERVEREEEDESERARSALSMGKGLTTPFVCVLRSGPSAFLL